MTQANDVQNVSRFGQLISDFSNLMLENAHGIGKAINRHTMQDIHHITVCQIVRSAIQLSIICVYSDIDQHGSDQFSLYII